MTGLSTLETGNRRLRVLALVCIMTLRVALETNNISLITISRVFLVAELAF